MKFRLFAKNTDGTFSQVAEGAYTQVSKFAIANKKTTELFLVRKSLADGTEFRYRVYRGSKPFAWLDDYKNEVEVQK